MKKNLHDRILKMELKEYHLSTVSKEVFGNVVLVMLFVFFENTCNIV